MIINSFNELLQAGVDAIAEKIDPKDISFSDDFVIQIKIQGESWDGAIDYRGAKFIIDLQRAVIRSYNEINDTDIHPRILNDLVTVKVRVREGSSIYEILIDKFFNIVVSNMTGPEILLMFGITAACATGYLTKRLVLQHKERLAQMNHTQELADRLSGTIDKALDIIERKNIDAPPKKLIGRLSENDLIQLPGREPLPPDQAKELYPKKQPPRISDGFFDDNFKVLEINTEKRPILLKLDKEGYKFWAEARIEPEDVERLSDNFKTAVNNNQDLTIDLHLYISFDDKKIKDASIQEIGPPRENTKRFSDLITNF